VESLEVTRLTEGMEEVLRCFLLFYHAGRDLLASLCGGCSCETVRWVFGGHGSLCGL
jgi:hypothetical protein